MIQIEICIQKDINKSFLKIKKRRSLKKIYYKRFTLIMVNIASHLIKDLWRSKIMFFNKEKGKKKRLHKKLTVSRHYIRLRLCETKCKCKKKLKFGSFENCTYFYFSKLKKD
jgi:hypothetical protein